MCVWPPVPFPAGTDASKGKANQQRKRRLEGSHVHVREGGEGVVDLLDQSMIRNLRLGKARGRGQEDESSDDEEVTYNAQGKIVVRDDRVDAEAEARAKKKRSAVEMMHVSDEDEEFDDGEGGGEEDLLDRGRGGGKRSKRADGSAGRGAEAQGKGKKGGHKVRNCSELSARGPRSCWEGCSKVGGRGWVGNLVGCKGCRLHASCMSSS